MMDDHGEWTIVDDFVQRAGAYDREALVNYYVALKTKRYVILAGPPTPDKMCLAQALAEVLVPQPSKQWSRLQAHPWWVTHSGDPGHLAVAHARFSNLKLLDAIADAAANLATGHPSPFFVGLERMSPAEAVCYFDDLPKGLLWRPDGTVTRVPVPYNLYVTGTLDVEESSGSVPGGEEHRQAITIRLRHDEVRAPGRGRGESKPRPDWQVSFVRSAVHTGDQARAKLAQILSADCAPLAPLEQLERLLGAATFSPTVRAEALAYVANAFDRDGRGLFVESALENLSVAQDYALMQSVLPHVGTAWLESSRVGSDEVKEYLAPRFPRACAWMERLSRASSNAPRRRRARSDSTGVEVGPGPFGARMVAH